MKIDRLETLDRWRSLVISPDRLTDVDHVCQRLLSYHMTNYDQVERATGVPWYVVGALDYHEEGFRHDRYLGNGDPLSSPTRHVPQGRGPFSTWYDGAIDAIRYDHLDKIPHWDIVSALIVCEVWNGMGYAVRGLPSPYVWGATNQQRPGKYVADHKFDPSVWDKQIGCAAIFRLLRDKYGVDLRES